MLIVIEVDDINTSNQTMTVMQDAILIFLGTRTKKLV